jgi:hypothetical protein
MTLLNTKCFRLVRKCFRNSITLKTNFRNWITYQMDLFHQKSMLIISFQISRHVSPFYCSLMCCFTYLVSSDRKGTWFEYGGPSHNCATRTDKRKKRLINSLCEFALMVLTRRGEFLWWPSTTFRHSFSACEFWELKKSILWTKIDHYTVIVNSWLRQPLVDWSTSKEGVGGGGRKAHYRYWTLEFDSR